MQEAKIKEELEASPINPEQMDADLDDKLKAPIMNFLDVDEEETKDGELRKKQDDQLLNLQNLLGGGSDDV